MIDELTIKLFETIPIYPEEISAKELGYKLGIGTKRTVGLIVTSSSKCLIAESVRGKAKIYFTYPDEKSKDKTLEFLKNGGDDGIEYY